MPSPRPAPPEWPTILLAVVIYAGWLGLTFFHAALPVWLLVPLGGWFCAWQSSLQHEVIHGHPTRWRRVNDAIGAPPLLLFLPFAAYRISHLTHHRDERLTDPLDDPESWYWTPEDWARLSGIKRWLVQAQTTFAGRMLLGPPWVAGRYMAQEFVRIAHGNRLHLRIWCGHMVSVALVLFWVCGVCKMSFWLYLLAFVYPGTALMLMRSFAEHLAQANVQERIAVVENTPLFGLLFLHNNLHCVHHDKPKLPWYQIPAAYRASRAQVLAGNGGLVYQGYLDVARRFWLTPHDGPVHPTGRVRVRPGLGQLV